MLEPILIDPAVMVGKPIDPAARQTDIACATTLRELWSKEIAAEDVKCRRDYTTGQQSGLGAALYWRRYGGRRCSRPHYREGRTRYGSGPCPRDPAPACLRGAEDDAELQLFAAQVVAGADPAKALARLAKIDSLGLPANLRPVMTEVRAEIAIAMGGSASLREALAAMAACDDSAVTLQLLTARGREKGLIASDSSQAKLPLAADEEDGNDDGELPDERTLAPHVRELVRFVREKEPALEFEDRVMLGQYLERHGAPETASDVLHGRVATDRDTAGLRTYLMASICCWPYVSIQGCLGCATGRDGSHPILHAGCPFVLTQPLGIADSEYLGSYTVPEYDTGRY